MGKGLGTVKMEMGKRDMGNGKTRHRRHGVSDINTPESYKKKYSYRVIKSK